jgi:hypothetical protein
MLMHILCKGSWPATEDKIFVIKSHVQYSKYGSCKFLEISYVCGFLFFETVFFRNEKENIPYSMWQ